MEVEPVAVILPYNDKLEIMFQKRKFFTHKKPDRDYGFFGGHVEEGESFEQALAREVKEEWSVEISSLKELRLFKHYSFAVKGMDKTIEASVFLCKMPDLNKIKVMEGEAEIIKFEGVFDLDISRWDRQILREIYESLKC